MQVVVPALNLDRGERAQVKVGERALQEKDQHELKEGGLEKQPEGQAARILSVGFALGRGWARVQSEGRAALTEDASQEASNKVNKSLCDHLKIISVHSKGHVDDISNPGLHLF